MKVRVPSFAVFGDGVDHGQQLSHGRDQGNLLALSGLEQALVVGASTGL